MFPNMSKMLQPGKVGCAELKPIKVTKTMAKTAVIRGCGEYTPPGTYMGLFINGDLIMSDTRHERITNTTFVSKATGDVLIAGLGIGMILCPILEKDSVRTITVIEKEQDVIDLILPYFKSSRLTVIQGDIFTWKPPRGKKWNTIYFDIWGNMCSDNLSEMERLHRKFGKRLKRDEPHWMGSWGRPWCKKKI